MNMTEDVSTQEEAHIVVMRAFSALLSRAWLLMGSTIVVGALGALLIVNLPETFTSSATVLVSSKQSGAAGAMSMLKESSLGSLLGDIGGDESNIPTLRTLLGTRQLAIWATHRYKLDSVWTEGESRNKPMRVENMVKNWEGNFAWEELEDGGGFALSFRSPSATLSQAVVRGTIAWLDSAFRGITKQNGAIREAYLDTRLATQMRIVDSLQDSLAAYQVRNRILSPTVQMEGLARGASDLEIEAERMDLEIRTLLPSLGADNSRIRQMMIARDQTRSAASRLLEKDDRGSLIKGMRSGVRAAIELQRMQRQIQVQVAIFSFLLQQKEQISLDISKDLPSLTVIDPPLVPKKRTSPPRYVMMQAILVMWILFASIWIVLADLFRRHPLSASTRREWIRLFDAIPFRLGLVLQRVFFSRGVDPR